MILKSRSLKVKLEAQRTTARLRVMEDAARLGKDRPYPYATCPCETTGTGLPQVLAEKTKMCSRWPPCLSIRPLRDVLMALLTMGDVQFGPRWTCNHGAVPTIRGSELRETAREV